MDLLSVAVGAGGAVLLYICCWIFVRIDSWIYEHVPEFIRICFDVIAMTFVLGIGTVLFGLVCFLGDIHGSLVRFGRWCRHNWLWLWRWRALDHENFAAYWMAGCTCPLCASAIARYRHWHEMAMPSPHVGESHFRTCACWECVGTILGRISRESVRDSDHNLYDMLDRIDRYHCKRHSQARTRRDLREAQLRAPAESSSDEPSATSWTAGTGTVTVSGSLRQSIDFAEANIILQRENARLRDIQAVQNDLLRNLQRRNNATPVRTPTENLQPAAVSSPYMRVLATEAQISAHEAQISAYNSDEHRASVRMQQILEDELCNRQAAAARHNVGEAYDQMLTTLDASTGVPQTLGTFDTGLPTFTSTAMPPSSEIGFYESASARDAVREGERLGVESVEPQILAPINPRQPRGIRIRAKKRSGDS